MAARSQSGDAQRSIYSYRRRAGEIATLLSDGAVMERAKEIATIWLKDEFGFDVQAIETADGRRADLGMNDGEFDYTIEVKDKIDTGNHSNFSELPVGEGRVASIRADAHERLNRLDNILRDGSEQIAQTPRSEQTFNLIWFNFEGPNADILGRRLLYTFYGIADLCPRFSDDAGVSCVYFDFNAAHEIRNVHGVVICENCKLQIAINEFADDVGRFRHTPLMNRFGNAKYDPGEFETDDSKIVLRSSISRRDESKVLDEVTRQTGTEYYRKEMNRYTFWPGRI